MEFRKGDVFQLKGKYKMNCPIITSDQELSELVKRILATDICISDLDDTDARSPAKELASDFEHYEKKPGYWIWLAKTGTKHLFSGKKSESDSWKEFVEKFLRGHEELSRIEKMLTPENVESTLFPGVKEFYSQLPDDALRVYLTRNIRGITQAYAQCLGINRIYAEQFDKLNAIKLILGQNPSRKSWLVKGDSEEDQEVLTFLKFQKTKNRIDDIIGIYVTEEELNPEFEINLFQDYRPLVDLIKNYDQPK